MRILVVEDDESHARFITAGLKQAGHNVSNIDGNAVNSPPNKTDYSERQC